MSASIAKSSAAVAVDDLAFTLVASLRADGHLSKALTHISSGNWRVVEQTIAEILSSRASAKKLSDGARNALVLICDDRGLTGTCACFFQPSPGSQVSRR